eukprot:scaffold17726_cov53-Cyclotella_meneghiniana.AAC.1
MDDDTRTARQKAIAEKKRRLEEIKARRNAAAAPSSSSSSGAPNNLDDYIDELLKSPAPIAAAVEDKKMVETEDTTSAAVPSNDDAAVVKEAAPAVISESQPAAMTMMIPQVQVERFEIAIQCEEDDFPPPSLMDEDDDIEDIEDDESQQDSNNHDNNTDEIQHSFSHASDKQSTEPPPLLTQAALSKLVSTSEFTHFISTASKRVERVLGSSSEEGLFATLSGWAGVDFVNDYQDDDDDANTKKGKRTKIEQHPYQIGGFFNSKSTYQYVDWTEGRNITDVEWCPSHPEWVLTSYNRKQSFGSVCGNNNSNSSSSSNNYNNNNNPSTRHLSPHDPSSSFLSTTSLSHSSSTPNEGIVVIYNLIMDTRPEHIFTAGCPIVRTKFHPTEHPKLVLGGGTSGQLLVWDARVGRSPVQRSSVGMGHDVDMVGMDVLTDTNNTTTGTTSNTVVGASSNYKLVTASSDGKINYWSMNNMREPVESFTMTGENVNLSCLDVMHGSNNEGVVCGDERGGLHAVYSASASAGAGSSSLKRVVRTLNNGGGDVDDNDAAASVLNQDSGAMDDNEGVLNNGGIGHYGLVTSVAARPYMNNNSNKSTISSGGTFKGFPQGAGGLVVTTGVDWSTKLWAPAYTDKPLMSFLSNSYDYMCDVQWYVTSSDA